MLSTSVKSKGRRILVKMIRHLGRTLRNRIRGRFLVQGNLRCRSLGSMCFYYGRGLDSYLSFVLPVFVVVLSEVAKREEACLDRR